MKAAIYLLLLTLFAMNVPAQKKSFSLEELIPGGKEYSKLVPKTALNYKWYGDMLLSYDADTFRTHVGKGPFSPKKLNELLKKENLKPEQLSFIRIGDVDFARVTVAGKRMLFIDPAKGEILFEIGLEKEWQHIDFCPENRSIAFTRKNGLYITNSESQPFVVSEDPDPDIVCGQSVHRNEFGINKGTFWSPEGNYLAFYRMDESMVEDYPLVDISARQARLKSIKYPMAGMTSHEVTLGIYHLQSGQTIYLKTGAPADHYLTTVSWDPSEKWIYVGELNRDQNHLQLNKYDVVTGEKSATLFEENDEKYVEPQNPPFFLKKSPDRFIWQTRRDGYNHLYLYDTEGKLLRQLTQGDYEVTRLIGTDREEKNLFYISNEGNPVEFHIWKVDLKSGKRVQLSTEPGVHNGSLNRSGTFLTDRYSNQTTPLKIGLIDAGKGRLTPLQEAADPYEGYDLPEITLGTLKAADGETDLYYRLLKPVGFSAGKRYPVVVYVYGGPHSQGVKNNWLASTRGWEIYMAQRGYVVFSMDNRGTSNRGLRFEQATFRRLGTEECLDQALAARYLQSLPFVDPDRIGVHGWSFGGFLTTNLMLQYSDLFKVGVAGGPVIDWKYYEVMYGERYMDSPQDNPDGYDGANMNNLAGNLSGRLLIIHGDEDPTVVWQNSLSFLKACISKRTYPDYFVYPGHGHNMFGPDRVHLHEKITRYFDEHLKK